MVGAASNATQMTISVAAMTSNRVKSVEMMGFAEPAKPMWNVRRAIQMIGLNVSRVSVGYAIQPTILAVTMRANPSALNRRAVVAAARARTEMTNVVEG